MKTWTRIGSALLVVVLVLATAATASAKKPQINLQADRTAVRVGEAITLSVTVEGALRARPQLLGAVNFQVVGTSSSSSFNMINGVVSRSVTHHIQLRAVRSGKARLRAEVEARGKTWRSNALPVTVISRQTTQPPTRAPATAPPKKNGKREPIFILPRITPRSPVVGSQTTVEFYLYVREGFTVKDLDLAELPEFTGFVAYEMNTSTRVNFTLQSLDGENYQVALIKRWALFPVGGGDATVGSFALDVTVPRRSRRDRMDPFGDFELFFGGGQKVRAASDPFAVTVRPLPSEGRPADFTAGVGSYELSAELDKTQVEVGQPVQLRLVVSGDGNVDTIPRPQIEIDERLRVYSEQDKPQVVAGFDTVSGEKTFEMVLIATEPGEYEIPEIRVPFYDPSQKAYRVVTAGPLRFTATGEALAEQQPAMNVVSREAIELRGRDLRYLRADKNRLHQHRTPLTAQPWLWLMLGLWPLAVTAIAIYQVRAGRLRADRRSYRSRRAMKQAKLRLGEARKMLDGDAAAFYAELLRAVLGLIADKIDASAPGLERAEVKALLQSKNVPEEAVTVIDEIWREADGVRFGGLAADETVRKAAYRRARDVLVDLARGLEENG